MITKQEIVRRRTLRALSKAEDAAAWKKVVRDYLYNSFGVNRVSSLNDGQYAPFFKFIKTL